MLPLPDDHAEVFKVVVFIWTRVTTFVVSCWVCVLDASFRRRESEKGLRPKAVWCENRWNALKCLPLCFCLCVLWKIKIYIYLSILSSNCALRFFASLCWQCRLRENSVYYRKCAGKIKQINKNAFLWELLQFCFLYLYKGKAVFADMTNADGQPFCFWLDEEHGLVSTYTVISSWLNEERACHCNSSWSE